MSAANSAVIATLFHLRLGTAGTRDKERALEVVLVWLTSLFVTFRESCQTYDDCSLPEDYARHNVECSTERVGERSSQAEDASLLYHESSKHALVGVDKGCGTVMVEASVDIGARLSRGEGSGLGLSCQDIFNLGLVEGRFGFLSALTVLYGCDVGVVVRLGYNKEFVVMVSHVLYRYDHRITRIHRYCRIVACRPWLQEKVVKGLKSYLTRCWLSCEIESSSDCQYDYYDCDDYG